MNLLNLMLNVVYKDWGNNKFKLKIFLIVLKI
jgi:hypothetical protein